MLHLAPVAVWLAQRSGTSYLPETFEQEGFIHCTDGEQRVIEVANRYYTGDGRPFCVLSIDRGRVESEIVYEDPARVYPHIYGPLNVEAVSTSRHMLRNSGGRFIGLGAPLDD